MTDRKMSNFEFSTLNYFLIRAFLIGSIFNTLTNILRQDSWIIPILSFIPAIIIILILNYIINYEPKLNISEKILNVFNKKIGTIIIFFIIIFAFYMSTLNFLNMSNFIQSQFLNKTPLLVISIMFMLASFYIVSKEINVISRTSNILFYIGFILLILSILGLLPAIKIDNIKPFFTSAPIDYISGLNNFYSFNILPMFLLTIIPKNIINKPKIKKTLVISYIIASISIFFVIFETIATFGYELTKLYEYPEFFVLKHVVLVHLSSRVESILIIQLIFDVFIYNIFSIYFIGNSINSIFKTKNKKIIYFIICLLIVISTILLSKYNYYLDDFVIKFVPTITSIFTTFIIILIFIQIKISKK